MDVHNNVEQVFDNFVVKHRLQYDVHNTRRGPYHDAKFLVSIVAKRKDLEQDLQVSANADRQKDAVKTACNPSCTWLLIFLTPAK